jgi:hypothetical protein
MRFNAFVPANLELHPITDALLRQDELDILRVQDPDFIDPDDVPGLNPLGESGPGMKQDEPIEAENGQNEAGH